MILTPHLIVGAAIGQSMPESYWIIPAAFFSHYFLDAIPHWEYLDQRFRLKEAALKIALDLLVGLGLILIFFDFSWWVWLGVFFAGLPDLPNLLYSFWKENWFLKKYFAMNDLVHFFYPAPVVLGVFTQILVVVLAIVFGRG